MPTAPSKKTFQTIQLFIFTGLLALASPLFQGHAAEEPEKEKADGPDHDVVLNEDDEVLRLLKKAEKSRVKAETDPSHWPDCVKAYSKILQKFPNTVYLAKWSDGDRKNRAYGLGIYRSTSEKVAAEIAKLPKAGLTIYRAISDPKARVLMAEAQAEMNDRKMEQVAQTYFSSTYGDDALLWLAETAINRGSHRQAISYLKKIKQHPDPSISQIAVSVRLFLAQLNAGFKADAAQTLKQLSEQIKDTPGALRVGHDAGAAGLKVLQQRLAQIDESINKKTTATHIAEWSTYFGNAEHEQQIPTKGSIGVRKWSESIHKLLTGSEPPTLKKGAKNVYRDRSGTNQPIPKVLSHHLTARGNWFFLTGGRAVVCHSVSNPVPASPKFRYPSHPPQNNVTLNSRLRNGISFGIRRHPYFSTLGGDYLYLTIGPDATGITNNRWGGTPPKQQPNWLVAIGKKRGGKLGVESGSLLWTLEPGSDPEYRINSKVDQEWLKETYLASSPTYYSNTLYTIAISTSGGTKEAWGVAFDAMTGRLLWKTMICSARGAFFASGIQPDLALPVAASGGQIFCVTNLGAVAALDAATGSVRWIRVYDRVPNIGAQQWNQRGTSGVDFWGPNPPIVTQGLLIITPQDSNKIYALDVQTGRRKWEELRVSEAGSGADGDSESLTHIIGLCNGRLILSGRDIVFRDVRGGRLEARVPLRDNYEIQGRGVVAGDYVLIPTDKSILFVDGKLNSKGKPSAKLAKEFKWTQPEREPGNLFISGDVLYSVSATHVNAYFDLIRVEKKLNDRIKKNPGDLAAYLELGDVRHRAESFVEAINAFDLGLKEAAKSDDKEMAKEFSVQLRSKKFETYFASGKQDSKNGKASIRSGAFSKFERAYENAVNPEQKVQALWQMADAKLASKQTSEAVMLYHRLLIEQGETVYLFDAKSSSKASVFARHRIDTIKAKHPDAVKALEALASEALQKAQKNKDPKALQQVIYQFQNCEAYGTGLFALGNLYLKKGEADSARIQFQRFLTKFRTSPKVPEALALLSLAYEQAGKMGAAKSALRKLSRNPKLSAVQISLPNQPAQAAGVYAKARLKEPKFDKPSSRAPIDLANGRLAEGWSQASPNSVVPLHPQGTIPTIMQSRIVYVSGGSEIIARSGISGEESWKVRPAIPVGFTGLGTRCAWSKEQLILAGKSKLVAINSLDGKSAWTSELPQNTTTGGGPITSMLPANNSIIITQTGGLITRIDGQTGSRTWQTHLDGQIFGSPAHGDGFIAVCLYDAKQKPTIVVFESESGVRRLQIPIAAQRLVQAPLAVGEFIYAISDDNTLRAYNAADGKSIWEFGLDATPISFLASHDQILVVLQNLEIVVCDPNALTADSRLLWKATPEGNGKFTGVVADGEDVLLSIRRDNSAGEVISYKAKGGKLSWRAPVTNSFTSGFRFLAKKHLLTTRSSYDHLGRQVFKTVLIDRVSGKIVWDKDLSSQRIFALALFKNGLVIGDGRRMAGYQISKQSPSKDQLQKLKKQSLAKPNDLRVNLQLAQLQFEAREGEKALTTLVAVLQNGETDEDSFGQAYKLFAKFRKRLAQQKKTTIPFIKTTKPLKMDGDLSDWASQSGTRLESWRHVYLAGEEDERQTFKREIWNGKSDLSATLRCAYDDQHVYLAVEVKDDTHSNPQDKGVNFWNGDSLQIAFDLERDSGDGYSGKDFLLGMALNDAGKVLLWKSVERDKYIMKPLKKDGTVVRDEKTHTTRYEIALPLSFLGMQASKELKFGFTCMINDSDKDAEVTKGMAPSPGIWNPKFPGRYAIGELAEKQ